MRVLGVDPGLTRCGVGVVDGGPGLQSRLVEVSVVRTPSHSDVAHRLLTIASHVEAAIERHRPDSVAIEQVFSQHNVMTVIGVAQATGVVAVTAARHGIPVAWHTPSEVKAAVSGNGNADKAQVTAMVTRLLRLTAPPKPADAADALALAICHLLRFPMQSRMAMAARQVAALELRAAEQVAATKALRARSVATAPAPVAASVPASKAAVPASAAKAPAVPVFRP